MSPLAGAGRPRTACVQCRLQKLRCSGESPSCARCVRLHHECKYRTRVLPQQSASHQRRDVDRLASRRDHAWKLANQARAATSKASTIPSALNQDNYLGVPSSLMAALSETYFSCTYNAFLLLHKPSFMRQINEGTAKHHVVLSVCAMATSFHRDNGELTLKRDGFGLEWAERAGKLVFQEMDDPTEDNVVTCLILALYWYSQGSWRKCYIYRGNAMQAAHVLRLGHKAHYNGQSLRSELSRRRFWACYLMECHSSDQPSILGSVGKIDSLPLPWTDEEFERGASSSVDCTMREAQSSHSIYGFMIRALTFWSQAYTLIKASDAKPESKIGTIHSFHTRLSDWWSTLPASIRLQDLSNISPETLPRLLLINATYYQSLCALHSSIVPLFSWGEDDAVPLLARQISAQIAFEHASKASELFDKVMDSLPNETAIPSFVAYAAYCGCAIQIPFMSSSNKQVKKRAVKNVEVNLRLIRQVAKCWKYIELLGKYASYLLDFHTNHPLCLEGEPKYLDPKAFAKSLPPAPRVRSTILAINRTVCGDDGPIETGTEPSELDISSDHAEAPSRSVDSTWYSGQSDVVYQRTRAYDYGEEVLNSDNDPAAPMPSVRQAECMDSSHQDYTESEVQGLDFACNFLDGADMFMPWTSMETMPAAFVMSDMASY